MSLSVKHSQEDWIRVSVENLLRFFVAAGINLYISIYSFEIFHFYFIEK